MNKMQRSLKRLFCLLLSAIMLIGIAVPASADTVTYNYKVKANTTLNVRSDPSTDYASIGSISGNTRICVTETVFAGGRNWGKITYKGRDAWVCIDYCDKIDDRPVNPEIPSEMKVDWTVIDISKFQRPEYFDWNALKASGVKGVIIRIGGRGVLEPRTIYSDDSFMTHYNGAVAAGLFVGVYFFSYALNADEAREEANFVVDTLKSNNCRLLMPVFIDIEDYLDDRQHRQPGVDCDSVVNTFCSTVKAAGYYPGIYCSLDYTRTVLSPSVFSGRAVWIAHWNTSCGYDGTYHMWQYTDKGELDGYPYRLDISRCYMNFPKIISEGQNENPSKPGGEGKETYGDHTASDWRVKKQATCSEAGERVKVCTDSGCGKTLVTEVIQPSFSSHSRSTQFVSLVDTDIKAGDRLSSSQKSYLHSASEKSVYGITYAEACETSGGVKLTYCKNCKTVMTVSYYYKDTCAHASVKKTEISPSCTKSGVETDTCVSCGKIAATRITSPISHNTNNTATTATCASDGEKTFSCSTCGKTVRTEYAPKTYHNFDGKYNPIRPNEYDGTVSVQVWCKTCSQNIVFTTVYGDTESKESVAVSDARNALRSAVGLDTMTPLQAVAADIDMSGDVTVTDARYILRIAVDLDDPVALYDKFIKNA